ncbi:sensor histidine kinase [Pseudonocardia sp.]|uniref:sensor histidine kinase n=1 Tax=Pseudonocardia sp. TaxID=60912 RepID=UPI003D0AA0B3
MRRRILQSTLLVVAITALVLGGPLAITTWRLVEDFTRADLISRLDQVASSLDGTPAFEGIDDGALELAIPAGGQLVLESNDRIVRVLGVDPGPDPVSERLAFGPGGAITMSSPRSVMRAEQIQVTVVVLLLAVASVVVGGIVANLTARRLAEPLRDVADRAARLGAGDFRRAPARHDIPELDRVSDVLDTSAAALAELVQRERTLVGDVSHQLRSRLTALQLRLDELASHPDPSAREEATAALEQTERLGAVLDELLEAARAARAAGAEPVDLRAGVQAVADEWRPALKAAGRSVKVRVPEGLTARVTPARLREAVGALVDNALRHGAGTVTVSARAGESSLVVEVSDHGAGVPDELVPHIFERGVSGRSSTGLGLALARALVEADGGRLELSRPRPAVFTIFLPAVRPNNAVVPLRPSGPR